MDGAFFRLDVLGRIAAKWSMEYTNKMSFYPWLGLKERIGARRRWTRVDDGVECFALGQRLTPWERTVRIVVYRKRVFNKIAKDFHLDLSNPEDGY